MPRLLIKQKTACMYGFIAAQMSNLPQIYPLLLAGCTYAAIKTLYTFGFNLIN